MLIYDYFQWATPLYYFRFSRGGRARTHFISSAKWHDPSPTSSYRILRRVTFAARIGLPRVNHSSIVRSNAFLRASITMANVFIVARFTIQSKFDLFFYPA